MKSTVTEKDIQTILFYFRSICTNSDGIRKESSGSRNRVVCQP